jgi:bifunctional non-homologous end joining protein LigD
MLLTSGASPAGELWAAEVKWDGIRAQVRLDCGRLTVRSRPGRDCTQDFPELDQLAGSVRRHRLVLDGELVCLAPDGAPDFAAPQTADRFTPARPDGGRDAARISS